MYQSPFQAFAPYLIITGIVLFLIGTIYLISRVRSDQMHFTFKHALEGYFYLMTVISFIIFTFGMVMLLNGGVSAFLGKDFSYGSSPPYYPAPMKAYPPGDIKGQAEILTPEQQAELQKKEEARQLEEYQKRQSQTHREAVTEGIGMAFVGGVVWVLHLWGRRRSYVGEPFSEGIKRAYLVLMLSLYSIIGIVSITSAVSRALRLYIVSDIDKNTFYAPLGPMVAAAIIFVPVWIYYLRSLINELRKKENEVKADTR